MFGFFRERSLEEALSPTQIVRVHGVKFKIRKLNPLDYLSGSRAVRQIHETQKAADSVFHVELKRDNQLDIEKHFIDTFLSAVVEPKLLPDNDASGGEGFPARNLLTDWDFANELYRHIIEFSYGKKKVEALYSKIASSK